MSPAKVRNRRLGLAALVVAVALLPAAESDFQRGLDSDAVIIGLLVLSVVVLTGFVGQISFCQYSFAAMGAFTVGSLMDGHGWSFWLALPVGVAVAHDGALLSRPRRACRLQGSGVTRRTSQIQGVKFKSAIAQNCNRANVMSHTISENADLITRITNPRRMRPGATGSSHGPNWPAR